MPMIEYLNAETCLIERVDVELEVSLSVKHSREIWLACGYELSELRTIGWPEDDGELSIQAVPVSILIGRSIA